MTLPDGRTAVIAAGDLEAASIGSYSVTIFKDAQLGDFVAGIVRPRDGTVFEDKGAPRVQFADIDQDKKPELLVTMLSAGSGNYQNVDAFKIESDRMRLLAHVEGLTPRQDIVHALQLAWKNCQKKRGKNLKVCQ